MCTFLAACGGAAPTLTSIAVTPQVANIKLGATQQFAATGMFSDNKTQVLSGVTWSASGGVVRIDPTTGVATGIAAGSGTVIATEGAVSGSAPIAAAPAGISPQSATFVAGSGANTVRFSASEVEGSIRWFVNGVLGGNASVGTIDSSGLYTAPDLPPQAIPVTITWQSDIVPAVRADASVTILNPTPGLTSMTPKVGQSGASSITITLNGSDFNQLSILSVGGKVITPTLVSSNQLTAALPSTSLAAPAVLEVFVSNPAFGGGTTSSFPLTLVGPGVVSRTNNGQVASYSIEVPTDANVSVEFGPDTNYGLQTRTRPSSSADGTVTMLVAGMRAPAAYHMRAVVAFPDGTNYNDQDHVFNTTGPDAAVLPRMVVHKNGSSGPKPGSNF